jgi:hypothetical protein
LEVLVAITGLGLTYGLPKVGGLLAPTLRQLTGLVWVTNVARLVSAFGFLVVPATAMGATLPVLVGGVMPRE